MNWGVYRPGDSLLHRLDPRLKLCLLPMLMAAIFSAPGSIRLLLLAGLWLLGARALGSGWREIRRLLLMIRWLLLGTLLLHLLFTPGRTLFGTTWLSYDGLLRGLQVDMQLVLALLFALLLSWTTRPEALIWGLSWMLQPLQRFKLPVQEAAELLSLVFYFLPRIQQERSALAQASSTTDRRPGLQVWAGQLDALLGRLFLRAEQLAQDIAQGRLDPEVQPERGGGWSQTGLLFGLILSLPLLFLIWQV